MNSVHVQVVHHKPSYNQHSQSGSMLTRGPIAGRNLTSNRPQSIATAALALGVVTDVFTAASLSYFLHKMRTGYSRLVSHLLFL